MEVVLKISTGELKKTIKQIKKLIKINANENDIISLEQKDMKIKIGIGNKLKIELDIDEYINIA